MAARHRLALVSVVLLLVPVGCTGEDGQGQQESGGDGGTPTPERTAEQVMADMDRDEKIGQLFVPTVSGTTPEENSDLISEYHPGGLIYFPENLTDTGQIAELSNGLQELADDSGAGVPLLLGVDQEQGTVARLPVGTRFPDAMAVGATRSTEHAAALAGATADELAALGITMDYAPVADVNVDPDNPVIGIRSFGSDPELVGRMAAAQARAFQEGGVAPVVKHFPGHGDTDVDSHTGLPTVDVSRETWEERDLPPFRQAVDAGVDAVMTAHVLTPELDDSGEPATLSPGLINGVLRDELGYDGVVTTDALNMDGVRQTHGDGEIAVRALEAGADQLLMPPDLETAVTAVRDAVEEGRISQKRLDDSVRRVLTLKAKRGLYDAEPVNPEAAEETVGSEEHQQAARDLAEDAVTLLRNEDGTLPLDEGDTVHVTGTGAEEVGERLSEAGIERVGTASEADTVVVGTTGARDDAQQRQRVTAAAESGTPVVVVAQGTPYSLAEFGEVEGYLATYSDVGVSRAAAARVLTGEVDPSGKLPVDIPGADAGYGDGESY